MPLFYFDVRQSDKLVADTEGEELADVTAAQREAAIAAVHLAKELLSDASGNLVVEVRNEMGKRVARAKVSLDVESLNF